MKVEKSAVRTTANGTVEQDISYQVGEKTRRKIVVGFNREHLAEMVRERCRELERQ